MTGCCGRRALLARTFMCSSVSPRRPEIVIGLWNCGCIHTALSRGAGAVVVEHGSPERFMCNSASLRRSEDEIGPRNCGRIHTARSRGAGAVVVEHGSPKRFTCNSASLRRSEDEIGPRNCGRVHTAPSRERRCDGTLPARTSHVQQLLSPTIRSREGTSEMPIGPHLRPPEVRGRRNGTLLRSRFT